VLVKDLGSVYKGNNFFLPKDEVIKFYLDNSIPNPLNFTFTQKQRFCNQNIDNQISETNFYHFLNRLNRKVFGNSCVRFNKGIKSFVVREYDEIKRHHLHTILETPKHIELIDYVTLINECWLDTDWGYKETHYEKPINEDREIGWLNYILKNYNHQTNFDCIDWSNTKL